jgi:hypothetical protein
LGPLILLSWLLVPRIVILAVNLLDDEFDDNPTFRVPRIVRRSCSQSIDLAIVVSLIALKSLDETVEEAHNAAFSALLRLSVVGRGLISSRFDWWKTHDLSVEVDLVRENKFAPEIQVD